MAQKLGAVSPLICEVALGRSHERKGTTNRVRTYLGDAIEPLFVYRLDNIPMLRCPKVKVINTV
jgi:hypothetical protein